MTKTIATEATGSGVMTHTGQFIRAAGSTESQCTLCPVHTAAPGEVLRAYKKNEDAYKQHNTACPQMGVHYNVEMPGVDISNMRANANFYSVQSVWACRKWWKKYFAWIYDTARLNAAICWESVDKNRTHAQFMDELIDAYCWNRLDDGVSWKERRTGVPEIRKGITRSAKALRTRIVDSLVVNQKIQPKVLKDLPLKTIRDIAEKCDHEPILYSQSRTFLTKQVTKGIGKRKGDDKR